MKAYVALGSNILPEANLIAAADLLRGEWPEIRFSHVYRTKAVGHTDQADFLNAAAVFDADRDPLSVLGKLKQIEEFLGKAIAFKDGPRTIDLDLLLYGGLQAESPDFTIPHPRMHERRFVLEPLCELMDGNEKHPVLKKSWHALLKATRDQACEKTGMKL